jgi:DNA-binding MarR family transcriptional regulator
MDRRRSGRPEDHDPVALADRDVKGRSAVRRGLANEVTQCASGVLAGELEHEISSGPDCRLRPSSGARALGAATVRSFGPLLARVKYLRDANTTPLICASQVVSLTSTDTPITLDEPPEPDPFSPEEFAAWRGMLRVHSVVFRELDRQLLAEHGFGVDAYGVMITLVTAPARRLAIGELGLQRHLSPSGISRSVDRLTKLGLVERATNPDDGRSLLVGLTTKGLRQLREAQVTHHRIVREMLFAHLDGRELKRLGELWEKAMPGAVSSPTWPL